MLAAALVLGAAVARADAAQEEPVPERRPPASAAPALTPQLLSFRYVHHPSYPRYVDRESVSGAAIGAMDLVHAGLREGEGDPLVLRLVKWGFAAIVDEAVLFVAHEYGHLSSLSKSGHRDLLFGRTDEPQSDWEAASPGGLLLNAFRAPQTGVTLRESAWEDVRASFDGRPEAYNRFLAAMEAGGVNQEQAIVARYADRLRQGRLSFLDTIPYFLAATGTARYPLDGGESDIEDYAALLEERGLETSGVRIKFLSAARMLSGSALAAARGIAVGFAGPRGEAVEPLELSVASRFSIGWPEIESYLTQIGPTLKLSVAARAGDWTLIPSAEHLVVDGASVDELGLRVAGPLAPLVGAQAAFFRNSRGGLWAEAVVEIRPLEWLTLLGGYRAGREYSFRRDLFGASNDSLEEREQGFLVGAAVAYRF